MFAPVSRSTEAMGRVALAVGAGLLLAAAFVAGRVALGPSPLAVPGPGFVLSGLTVVNPGAERLAGRSVVVRGERIEAISASTPPEASDAYAGSFVLPGLVDLHVHHPPRLAVGERELFALLFLLHGVTGVRDVGSFDGGILEHRQRIADGELAGPRVFACGQILDAEPASWPGARLVRSPQEARRAVAELARQGVDCIKAYNGLSLETFEAIREGAEAHGLPVVAHVPFEVPFARIRGVEVQHLMGLTLDWSQLDPAIIDRYVHHSLARGIRHTPTLVAFARGAGLTDYARAREDPTAKLLPRHYRELIWNPGANPLLSLLSPGDWQDLAVRLAEMRRVVGELHRSGVRILAGSDTMNPFVVPGAGLQEEVRLLAASGLGPEQAWAVATRLAGEVLGVPGLGVVEVGAPADLVIFAEDPTRDLGALASLQAVVTRGRLYPREVLEAALERQLAYFDGALYSNLYRAVARLAIAVIHRTHGS